MSKTSLDVMMGFGGVHPAENDRALKWGRYLEAPMLVIALAILLDWYLASQDLLNPESRIIADWAIWAFFLVETSILTLLCSDRAQHLKRNWANVAIIALAFPMLIESNEQFGTFRLIRLFFLIGFFSHNIHIITNVLQQNHLGKTLIVSAAFITGAGILIAGIDPAISTPSEGIWWAWVTVTTVGYGDVVPTSNGGRVFASILILMGICLVSLITANVSAYLLSRSAQKELRYEQRQLRKLLDMEERLEGLEKKIDALVDEIVKNKK